MRKYRHLALLASLVLGVCTCTLPASTPPAATPLTTAAPILVSTATEMPAQAIALTPTPTFTLTATPTPEVEVTSEQPVKVIPLAGPMATKEAEISGMSWYGDKLILLPQYPENYGSGPDGALFYLNKADIIDFLDGRHAGPLVPVEIPLTAPGLTHIPGYEGLEAIAISGEQVFVTVEAKPDKMLGYLISGRMATNLSGISLNTGRMAPIQPQADLPNMTG
jgi:hypothetical protein